jgi:hypothetical protein
MVNENLPVGTRGEAGGTRFLVFLLFYIFNMYFSRRLPCLTSFGMLLRTELPPLGPAVPLAALRSIT